MKHKKIIFPATALLLSGVSIAGVISKPELLTGEPGNSAELPGTHARMAAEYAKFKKVAESSQASAE